MNYERISIEIKDASGLYSTEWRFWLNYPALVFDSYVEWSRPTKRHKFVCGDHWDRIEKRRGNIPRPSLPENVIAEALRIARDAIQVPLTGESK